MTWNSDSAMQALRLTYNAAVTAHTHIARTVTEATMRGEQPSPEMIDVEAKAKTHLTDERKKLHAAMALVIANGGAAGVRVEPEVSAPRGSGSADLGKCRQVDRTGAVLIAGVLFVAHSGAMTDTVAKLRAKYRRLWDAHQIIADENAWLIMLGKQPSNDDLIKRATRG